MSRRRVRVVVLCEGFRDFRFAYSCLVTCGWRSDQIAAKVSPKGRGSAFSYVLDNYPAEVRANRDSRERTLLVLIDADNQPEGGREAQLAQRLQEVDEKPRQARERIALWVPRRQLETWICFLMHGGADEETDYKREHHLSEEERKLAAKQFAQFLKKGRALPSGAVPSMKKAVVEFGRLRASPSRGAQSSTRRR